MAGVLPLSFSLPAGVATGRVTSPRVTPPEGDAVLSLGAGQPGIRWTVAVGDRIAAEQSLAKDEVSLRGRIICFGPQTIPVLSAVEPFSFADGETLIFELASETYTITLDAADFADITNATAFELGSVIIQDSAPITARLENGGRLAIEPERAGRIGGEIRRVSGTAAAALGAIRLAWAAIVSVDGTEYSRRLIRPGDERNLVDLSLPLDSAADPATYELALELVDRDGGSPVASADVEVPTLYYDDIAFQERLAPWIGDRSPEPNEINRHVDAAISISLASEDAADSPDLTTIEVTVTVGTQAPSTAVSAGVVQSPWDGTGSGVTLPRADQARVILVPTSDLPGETTITIEVSGETVTGDPLTSSYSFVTEDIDPPAAILAIGGSATSIDVQFDEVLSDEPGGTYTISPIDLPAVTPLVTESELLTPDTVRLTLDREISPGRLYQITVSGVEDSTGNISGTDVLQFEGWACPRVPGRNFDLIKLLPEINTVDRDVVEDLRKFIACLQEIVDLQLCDIDQWIQILDPDIAPEIFLDAMLMDLGNPFDFALTVAQKRRLIRILIDIYQTKGTAVGIENTIRFFAGIDVDVRAVNSDETWILGVSELEIDTILGTDDQFLLYSYRIIVDQILTEEERDIITTIALYMQPAHTHLIEIVEPEPPLVIDHLELGLSELGVTWILH